MADKNRIMRATLAAQTRFFSVAEDRHDLTRKAISIDTDIPVATLASWASGTVMPFWAINSFARAGYPDALLSILTEPGEREVITPQDSGDLDELAREAAGFTAEKLEADADGVRTTGEVHRLRQRARRLSRVAAQVAA